MNLIQTTRIGRKTLLLAPLLAGIALNLSGCIDPITGEPYYLRSCYNAAANCGWNHDREDSSPDSDSSSGTSPSGSAGPTDPT